MQKDNPSIISKPKICCIDVNDNIIESLKTVGFEIFSGTLGSIMEVPNKYSGSSQLISLDYNFPSNIHEYDVFIIDLTNKKNKEFLVAKNHEKKTRDRSIVSVICSYPTNVFDPRPISSYILGERLNEVKNKKIIVIVFAAEDYKVEYEFVKINDGYTDSLKSQLHSLYSFDNTLDIGATRFGKEVSIGAIREELSSLLNKHLQKLTYEQIFIHSRVFDSTTNQYVEVGNIIPLMKNSNDEIVSLIKGKEDKVTFIFPNIYDKEDLLTNLLKNILPSIYPAIFPFSSQFKWVENSEYYLPYHKELIEEKVQLQLEFENKQNVLEKRILENNERFKFLHDLIIQTGDKLVTSLFSFFQWLGYEKVIIKDDESSSIKEEDLQIELENGILIIETKGIAGTSTDSDCSQISKIKYRRCKERKAFDVFALYIVNHQRFLPPFSRKNPPFTEQQIQDALNDERGLVSTWQLFNLYYEIHKGIISKELARKQLLDYGLIKFRPNVSRNLGFPKEIFGNGFIVVIDIKETKIKKDDILFLEKDGNFIQTRIISMQLDGKDIQEADNGEVGLKLSDKAYSKTLIWI